MVRLQFESAIESRLRSGRGCPSAGKPRVNSAFGTTQRDAHMIDALLRAGVNAVGEMVKPRLTVVGADITAGARSNVA